MRRRKGTSRRIEPLTDEALQRAAALVTAAWGNGEGVHDSLRHDLVSTLSDDVRDELTPLANGLLCIIMAMLLTVEKGTPGLGTRFMRRVLSAMATIET